MLRTRLCDVVAIQGPIIPAAMGRFTTSSGLAAAVSNDCMWSYTHFHMPHSQTEMVKIPSTLLAPFTDTLCYAALWIKSRLDWAWIS